VTDWKHNYTLRSLVDLFLQNNPSLNTRSPEDLENLQARALCAAEDINVFTGAEEKEEEEEG